MIEDVSLAAPLKVRALLDQAAMGEAAVQGLIARQEPAMLRALTQSELRGELRARRAALRAVVSARAFSLTAAQEARVDGCDDAAELDAWVRRAVTAARVEDALGE